jgi:predicted HTH transcriptional regulator
LERIRLGEDSILELKDLRYNKNSVSEPHRNSIADALSAMANTADGVIIFGVDDKTRKVTGIPEDKLDTVEAWLRDICNGLVKPQIFCKISKQAVETDDGLLNIICVNVPKSLFIHQSPGGYFERIGAGKRQISPERLARLFQQRSQARVIYFDEQAVPNAPVEALQKDLWERFKTPRVPSEDESFLFKLKFITRDENGKTLPTVSGILMACATPQEYLPSAYIQAVSYRGNEPNAAYQLDAQDITGPLDKQINDACSFVKKNMRVFATKEPARRDIPQYSMQAVFEAIVNAVAHRDYSIAASKIRVHVFENRLEIFSPGAIPNTMTIETLALRQATRNELLTSMLSKCTVQLPDTDTPRHYFLERRGEGVPIIINESEKLSGKTPEFRLLDDSELMLTIFAASV